MIQIDNEKKIPCVETSKRFFIIDRPTTKKKSGHLLFSSFEN